MKPVLFCQQKSLFAARQFHKFAALLFSHINLQLSSCPVAASGTPRVATPSTAWLWIGDVNICCCGGGVVLL
jgi:hypothetical protein